MGLMLIHHPQKFYFRCIRNKWVMFTARVFVLERKKRNCSVTSLYEEEWQDRTNPCMWANTERPTQCFRKKTFSPHLFWLRKYVTLTISSGECLIPSRLLSNHTAGSNGAQPQEGRPWSGYLLDTEAFTSTLDCVPVISPAIVIMILIKLQCKMFLKRNGMWQVLHKCYLLCG